MNLEKRFEASLDSLDIADGNTCLVALSGGGDSVALLELLCRERKRRALTIHAARIIHGIRETDEEEAENELCRRLCRKSGVALSLVDVSSDLHSGELRGRGPEQAARTVRCSALESLSKELGADVLMFGHTADDQLETVMMRLLSGAGPEGLKGIDGRKGRTVRPLLFASRAELRIFLKNEGILWAEDRTNSEADYRRNRVRNELLPLVSEIFPGWPSALFSLAERSSEALEALRLAGKVFLPVESESDSYSWDENRWRESPSYLQAMAIWSAVDNLDDSGLPDRRFPWKSVKAARNSLSNGKKWASYGFETDRHNGRIFLRRTEPNVCGRIVLEREDAIAGFDAVLAQQRIRVSARRSDHKAPKAVSVVKWPLEIRFSRDRDELAIDAQTITEKSSDRSFADAGEEIFYISIVRVMKDSVKTEGNDA